MESPFPLWFGELFGVLEDQIYTCSIGTSNPRNTAIQQPSTSAVSTAFDEPTRTTKFGRAVKETTVWEQKSQPRRPRGPTLKVVALKPVRKIDGGSNIE